MSEAEEQHQLDETPPGDARDPARSEVRPDAPDAPRRSVLRSRCGAV